MGWMNFTEICSKMKSFVTGRKSGDRTGKTGEGFHENLGR